MRKNLECHKWEFRGYLRKKAFFPRFLELFGPSGNGEKGRKGVKKADFQADMADTNPPISYGAPSPNSPKLLRKLLGSGKSKGGLSKGGLGPKGANWAKKGPFGPISALPPWLWGAEELVPIGPEKAPE